MLPFLYDVYGTGSPEGRRPLWRRLRYPNQKLFGDIEVSTSASCGFAITSSIPRPPLVISRIGIRFDNTIRMYVDIHITYTVLLIFMFKTADNVII